MSSSRPLALLGVTTLALAPLLAQEAPPVTPAPAPTVPVAPAAVIPAVTPPAPVAPGAFPGGERGPRNAGRPSVPARVDSVGRVTLVDEQPAQVVALLEKITGRIALRSGDLPNVKINFNSGRDLSRTEAINALQSLLALNGVAAIDDGERYLKVVAVAKGREVSAEGPQLYLDSVVELPDSERFISRLFTLSNVPYATVDAAIQSAVNKTRGGNAVPLPNANAVLVTDSLSNIKRIESIIATADAAPKVIFVPLRNTRASDVVRQLKSLQAGGLKTAFGGDVAFESSEVNNQVMVMTKEPNEARIRAIIAGIDTENAPVTRAEVLQLHHGEAADAVQLIQNVATGASGVVGRKAASSFTAGQSGASVAVNAASNFNTQVQAQRLATLQAQNNAAARGGAMPETASAFSSVFTAVADLRSNSLIVYGTDRDIKQAKDLVDTVDVQLQQVRIEAVIVEVTLGDARASGLDTLGLGIYTGTQGVDGGRHNGDYNFNTSQPNLPGTNTPPLSLSASIKDFSIQALLAKSRDDRRVKVLSSPIIVTSHNAKASIIVSTQQPVITGTLNSNNGVASTASTVTYKDIGLELGIIPRIGSNGVVEMDVMQSIGSVIGSTTIDGNSQPIISNRSATSYLTAENGETIVLAGLQAVNETKTKGKMFILGYIPFLGDWLFSPETSETTKTELIIFLKPYVLTRADKIPAKDTPGLREGSLTKEIAEARLKDGAFEEMTTPVTIFEEEAVEARRLKESEKKEKAEAEADAFKAFENE